MKRIFRFNESHLDREDIRNIFTDFINIMELPEDSIIYSISNNTIVVSLNIKTASRYYGNELENRKRSIFVFCLGDNHYKNPEKMTMAEREFIKDYLRCVEEIEDRMLDYGWTLEMTHLMIRIDTYISFTFEKK